MSIKYPTFREILEANSSIELTSSSSPDDTSNEVARIARINYIINNTPGSLKITSKAGRSYTPQGIVKNVDSISSISTSEGPLINPATVQKIVNSKGEELFSYEFTD